MKTTVTLTTFQRFALLFKVGGWGGGAEAKGMSIYHYSYHLIILVIDVSCLLLPHVLHELRQLAASECRAAVARHTPWGDAPSLAPRYMTAQSTCWSRSSQTCREIDWALF
jgi:hypothetical protein